MRFFVEHLPGIYLGFVDLGGVYVHICAHSSSDLWTWVGCKYTNTRTSPRVCVLGLGVSTHLRAPFLGFVDLCGVRNAREGNALDCLLMRVNKCLCPHAQIDWNA